MRSPDLFSVSSQEMAPVHELWKTKQESLYAERGITAERIEKELQVLIKEPSVLVGMDKSVYLTSSDSLYGLLRAEVAGEKVLTVGGSGDFAQVLASQGAEKVDVFDISPYSCFWNELKLAAANKMDLKEYRDFILADAIMDSPGKSVKGLSYLDTEKYLLLRDSLTEQARFYFDFLMDKQKESALRKANHFTIRRSADNDPDYTKVPHLKDEDVWHGFKRSLPHEEPQLFCDDIDHIDCSAYDYCYISNIGIYPDRQMDFVRKMLKRGAKRIGMSLKYIELGEWSFDVETDDQGRVFYGYNKKTSRVTLPLTKHNGIPVSVGSILEINGLKVRVKHLDFHEDFQVYAEVWREDNLENIHGDELDNPFQNT